MNFFIPYIVSWMLMSCGAIFLLFLALANPYRQRKFVLSHIIACIASLAFGLVLCITLALAPRTPEAINETPYEMTELTFSKVMFLNQNNEETIFNLSDSRIEVLKATEQYSNVVVCTKTTTNVEWWVDVKLEECKYTVYLEDLLYERYSMGTSIYKKDINK